MKAAIAEIETALNAILRQQGGYAGMLDDDTLVCSLGILNGIVKYIDEDTLYARVRTPWNSSDVINIHGTHSAEAVADKVGEVLTGFWERRKAEAELQEPLNLAEFLNAFRERQSRGPGND